MEEIKQGILIQTIIWFFNEILGYDRISVFTNKTEDYAEGEYRIFCTSRHVLLDPDDIKKLNKYTPNYALIKRGEGWTYSRRVDYSGQENSPKRPHYSILFPGRDTYPNPLQALIGLVSVISEDKLTDYYNQLDR